MFFGFGWPFNCKTLWMNSLCHLGQAKLVYMLSMVEETLSGESYVRWLAKSTTHKQKHTRMRATCGSGIATFWCSVIRCNKGSTVMEITNRRSRLGQFFIFGGNKTIASIKQLTYWWWDGPITWMMLRALLTFFGGPANTPSSKRKHVVLTQKQSCSIGWPKKRHFG